MKVFPVLFFLILAAPLYAQSVYELAGSAATVNEVTGPPAGPCLYPDGEVFSTFGLAGSFACPLPGAVSAPPETEGDVAVDKVRDTVWVTDGVRIAEYTPLGVPLNSFALPPGLLGGLVTGMGFDSGSGTLWLTDGTLAAEVTPPAPCGQPAVVTAPFALPALGVPPGIVTDIAWERATGSLWVCDTLGRVGNVLPGGAIGPAGSYQATPGPCGLGTELYGLALDTAAQNGGTVYVTDGNSIAYLIPPGAAAPKTFYTPSTCYAVPGTPASGLAFAARPITYGAGGPGTPPTIGTKGQSIVPDNGLAITLSGAPPGALAVLPISLNPLCPAVTFLMAPIGVAPPAAVTLSLGVDPSGNVTLPTPLPPGTPLGVTLFYQWFVVVAGPSPDGPPLLATRSGSMTTSDR